MSEIEQRYALKFLVKLGKTHTDAMHLLQQAYADGALKKSAVFKWHQRFRDGRESVEDDDRSGRPSTSTNPDSTDAVQLQIQQNPRLSIGKMAAIVGISYGSVQTILTENLGMSRVCARWVPRLLTPAMRADRVQKVRRFWTEEFRKDWLF